MPTHRSRLQVEMKYRPEDHTFVICAYGNSPYIEECIQSLEAQKISTNIIMCTSTPSEYIRGIADNHGLRLFVNDDKANKSNIAEDWNYALSCADTALVTIAHQDDLYKPEYAVDILENVNRARSPLIAFTDYAELRNGLEVSNIKNLNIKRVMLFPLRFRAVWRSIFVRRRILSLGSAICCPSVTYVKDNLPYPVFDSGFRVSLDWQAWERLSRLRGDFVFVNRVMMVHRIHGGSETTKNIDDNNRTREDYEMFCKFWPGWIARCIEYWYNKSEDQNRV